MDQAWEKDYVQLGLRIDRVFPGFVDGYFGPPEWKAEVDAEPALAPGDLVRQAMTLGDAIAGASLPSQREAYLAAQVRGLETMCRRLAGEDFTLREEVESYYDIQPQRLPEAQFEQGLALYEAVLPGKDSLADRLNALRTRYELPRAQGGLVRGFMEQALAETRRRTRAFVTLPEDEAIEITTVTGQPWGAYNWYLGQARSRVELNTDLPTDLSRLVDTMAHEGYPGHHTEHALKEQLLWRARGYAEHSILLINTPECVISEGIATLAAEMIFAPGETKTWLDEHIYPVVGMPLDGVDPVRLQEAGDLLAGVVGNAAFLLHEDGRPDDEVAAYIMRYSLLPEARARKQLEFLKSPLWRAYIFTYFYGKRLMRPLLQGPDRLAVFRRFLTEQVTPAQLAATV